MRRVGEFLRAKVEKIPFRIVGPMIHGLYYLLLILAIPFMVVALPLHWFYGLILREIALHQSKRTGKDIVVVQNMARVPNHFMTKIEPLLGDRAMFLDFAERHQWPKRNLAVRLYRRFGPKTTVESLNSSYLPVVLLI